MMPSSSAVPLSPDASAARVIAPADTLFARRAARLSTLADAHPAAGWLTWLASLCTAQQQCMASAGPHADWRAHFHALAARFAPDAALPGADDLLQREARTRAIARGEDLAQQRDLTDLLVGAALQVSGAHAARLRLDQGVPALLRQAHCPCCGGAALGAIVLAGEGRAGQRYLECALCATRWHAVRAHCSLCEGLGEVEYLGLQGAHPAVQAEACTHCHAYLKTCFQTRDAQVEPLADDLATLMLDVLVGEQGYLRAAPNLFLCDVQRA
ncbi:MAG: formate dehydrogenase accessory protein FdhE [Candidatus Dactylopiibacterium sp.]|nr:formate dehydrogenase accessory protein FdhE [Candidatus Dactylopiibacterium sp.]